MRSKWHHNAFMKLQEIQAMSDEEIRVKIAELVGTHTVTVLPLDGGTMTHVTDEKGRIRQIRQMDDGPRAESYPRDWTALPNYPADLNACHGFARGGDDYARYCHNVRKIVAIEEDCKWPKSNGINATARQRCEALILTLSEQ